ncbi:MAG TPA: hypothetical protein ENJ49_00530, partial [Candidatus Moranbacteria bacterium]|nr:hypothetical protein [Candidatus Moranbacteria bacterium]
MLFCWLKISLEVLFCRSRQEKTIFMDINKFTHKSQEAIKAAQELALSKNQQQVDTFHLLSVLMSQSESIVPTILQKMEVNISDLQKDVENEIEKLPKVS